MSRRNVGKITRLSSVPGIEHMLAVEGQGAQKQSKQGAKLEKIYRQ